MPSILLDAKSIVMVSPVTLDDEGEVANVGLPTQVSLQDLADWIVNNGTPEESGGE